MFLTSWSRSYSGSYNKSSYNNIDQYIEFRYRYTGYNNIFLTDQK